MADFAKPKSGLPKKGAGIRGTKGGPVVRRGKDSFLADIKTTKPIGRTPRGTK